MDNAKLADLETLFLALGDKTRLRLIGLMADGEVPVGYLCDSLGDSQPKVSRHLAYLRNAGVVTTRRDGKRIYYGLREFSDPGLAEVLGSVLDSIAPGNTIRSDAPIREKKQVAVPKRVREQEVEAGPRGDEYVPTSSTEDFEDEFDDSERYDDAPFAA